MKKTPLVRRTPLRSRKPLSPTSPPKRSVGVRRVNAKRAAKLWQRNFHSAAYLERIHSMCCAVCEVTGWTEAAHVRSRGAGGDASDIVPLCGDRYGVVGCHRLFDERKLEDHRMRLRTLAKKLWAEWSERVEL